MLIVFLLILLVGLTGFAVVFMKALKGRDVPEPFPLRPVDRMPHDAVADPVRASLAFSTDELPKVDELKIVKLEQMLDEKNKMIVALQKGLQSGDDREAEVDGLKQILQAQIEELKQQNKQLRSDVARLSEENLDLQTKLYAGHGPASPEVERIVIHPAASTSPPETDPDTVVEDNKGHSEGIQVNSLSLHDVFGGEEEKNS